MALDARSWRNPAGAHPRRLDLPARVSTLPRRRRQRARGTSGAVYHLHVRGGRCYHRDLAWRAARDQAALAARRLAARLLSCERRTTRADDGRVGLCLLAAGDWSGGCCVLHSGDIGGCGYCRRRVAPARHSGHWRRQGRLYHPRRVCCRACRPRQAAPRVECRDGDRAAHAWFVLQLQRTVDTFGSVWPGSLHGGVQHWSGALLDDGRVRALSFASAWLRVGSRHAHQSGHLRDGRADLPLHVPRAHAVGRVLYVCRPRRVRLHIHWTVCAGDEGQELGGD